MRPICLFLLITLAVGMTALAEVPLIINYQGYLTDSGGQPIDGDVYITFSLHRVEVGDDLIWTSGPQLVTVTNGLFDYDLGSHVTLPTDEITNSTPWLDVLVAGGPSQSPRTQLTSGAFSFRALKADGITGDLEMDDSNDGVDVVLRATSPGGDLFLFDDGNNRAKLYGDSYGTLELYDNDYTKTATFDARMSTGGAMYLYDGDGNEKAALRGSSSGAYFKLNDASGAQAFLFDAQLTGPAAVSFPEGSIHSDDIFNEAGIVAAMNSDNHVLTSTMTDIETVTITTPEDGYILVQAKAYGRCTGTTGYAYGYAQIDINAGGTIISPFYEIFGASGFATSTSNYYPIFVQRVFYKISGTYTFRLEGLGNALAGGSIELRDPVLSAVFIPSEYGTVETMVASDEVGEFDQYEMVSVESNIEGIEPENTTAYKVDLRELELKATKARLEYEKAQRELLEAQMKQKGSDMDERDDR